jgi:hypothetical protein
VTPFFTVGALGAYALTPASGSGAGFLMVFLNLRAALVTFALLAGGLLRDVSTRGEQYIR